jgi:hypothetical protein
MGLFGGKSEDELRGVGTPTTARVTYVDDTGKRREGGTQAKLKIQLKIDSGSARGRDMEQVKWVPVTKQPHVGETVSIRFDPDDIGDWAWGDAAMYAPASAAVQPAAPAQAPAPAPSPGGQPADPMAAFFGGASPIAGMPGIQQMIQQAFAQGNVQWEHTNQVFDLRGDPAMRAQVIDALKAQGIDVEAMQAGGMPVAGAGGQPAQPAIPPVQAPGAGSGEDPTERLKRLDTLLEQGLVTADEHRELRQKIIDSI